MATSAAARTYPKVLATSATENSIPMALPRFLLTPLPQCGTVCLDDAEARHASQVLRLQLGASVELFDGIGGEARAVILSVSKKSVQLEIIQRNDTNRELHYPLELLVALPKGDRQKTLIDGLVQFGTTQLTPLNCERGVAQPTEGALERLRRSVVESSKQCGRNQLMRVSPPQSINNLVTSQADANRGLSLFAHPYGASSTLSAAVNAALVRDEVQTARVAIGPEGGFTEAEIDQLTKAGWTQIALGPRLLRIEFAALQIAAWWASLKS